MIETSDHKEEGARAFGRVFRLCVFIVYAYISHSSSRGLPLWKALGSWWWTLTHRLPITRALYMGGGCGVERVCVVRLTVTHTRTAR